MPSHDHCCVPLCSNRRDKRPDLSFHSFPKGEPTRSRWIVAIKRDEGVSFKVTANTVVCGAHFSEEDFYPAVSSCEKPSRKVLRRDAVPSVFSFRPQPPTRPSLLERREVAALRSAERKFLASLSRFGPLTKVEYLEKELAHEQKCSASLEARVASSEAENARLRSQVFRYANVKADESQFVYLTGLTLGMWAALWAFLKPSRENVQSGRSAATEAEGRVNAPGAGRKPVLTLEDQLLMTLMRLRAVACPVPRTQSIIRH